MRKFVKFISELLYEHPDRIIAWVGLLLILLFWLQSHSTNDGISIAIPKLFSNLINWHWDTIYFIKVDTIPHLITSILYWLVIVTILSLIMKLFQKARKSEQREESEITKAIDKVDKKIDRLIEMMNNKENQNNQE